MTDRTPVRKPWLREAAQVLAALPVFAITPLLRPWHSRWGATDAETTAPMPGDDLVAGCQYRTTRAITIHAQPHHVWPWLVQVGLGRAGFYSLDLLDNLARPSATTILPQYQDLTVGQWVPMSPTPSAATAFTVHSLEPERLLVWAKPDSTWVWQLADIGAGSTRVVTRIRTRYELARPAAAALSVLLMEVGDFAMLRAMLLGIKNRAERRASEHRSNTSTLSRDKTRAHSPSAVRLRKRS